MSTLLSVNARVCESGLTVNDPIADVARTRHPFRMTLRRYLLIIYVVTLGYLVTLIAVAAGDPAFPLVPMLTLAPVIALANTFMNVWPWARMVPTERRTGFRAYRPTNIFMALGGVLVLVCIGLKLAELAGR